MIWGENMKELERRVSKEYGLQINLEKTVMLKLSRNGGKNTGLKMEKG
jgi:hypothetical protein